MLDLSRVSHSFRLRPTEGCRAFEPRHDSKVSRRDKRAVFRDVPNLPDQIGRLLDAQKFDIEHECGVRWNHTANERVVYVMAWRTRQT